MSQMFVESDNIKCGNLCKEDLESCVRPQGYKGPFFCMNKNLIIKGVRHYYDNSTCDAASFITLGIIALILVFSIILFVIALKSNQKFNNSKKNNEMELQLLD